MASWRDILNRLVSGEDLETADTRWIMDQILTGEATAVPMAAFLAGLRVKGETPAEVEGLVDAMLEHAVRISIPVRSVDLVGTGGDGANTVNITTMASLVTAGAGLTVVKHGNRAASSTTGSSDVLSELGINLNATPERVAELATEVGITFCPAPVFHSSMKYVGPIRSELGIATTFNILGPLTNPAQPEASAIGASSRDLAPVIAGVLARKGRDGLVFRGGDGLDELAATAPSSVWEVRGGEIAEITLNAVTELGLPAIETADLKGGDPQYNASVVHRVMDGDKGAVRDTVLLNAAAGIVADATLPGTADGTFAERMLVGLEFATQSIDTGAAADVLSRWATASNN
ncbi:anthranilate phosphoribosyltransferase [Demequina aurantiaca]|uniref:anthranilate phosphoribosyltransferase n=1 Tax=Demequina aurantiaca TaxID=676200 RepID=UPI0007836B89|nr:anthranilate phosphoribosyltransferase [Demequina aurantiaca]